MLRLVPAVHRAAHGIALLLEDARDLDVTQAEAHILAHLADDAASTVAEIHRAFNHKRSTLTSILDRLEARGLITREVSAEDRRSFVVRLTRDGKTLARAVHERLAAVETRILRRFTREERDAFDRIMSAIAEAYESRA